MRKFGLLSALALVSGNALAIPVTWVANGTINFAVAPEAFPLVAQAGDRFSYAITFDNETPDVVASPNYGNFPGAIQSVVLSIGEQVFQIPFDVNYSQTYSYNDLDVDYYQFTFETNSAASGQLPQLTSQFGFTSTSPFALDSDAIPTLPPSDLSLYQTSFALLLNNGTTPSPVLLGQFDSIEQLPASVPEPATALIFATGLLAAGVARRKRQA